MQSNHGKYRRELVLGLLWIVYGFAMGCMVGLPWIVRGYAVGSGFCHVVCVFAVGIDWVWWWVVVLGLGWFGGSADWVWWWLFWVWVVGGCLRKRNGETEIRERNYYYYYTHKKKLSLIMICLVILDGFVFHLCISEKMRKRRMKTFEMPENEL